MKKSPEFSTEELRKQKHREYNAKWRAKHKKEITAYNKQYNAEHKDERAVYNQEHKKERTAYDAKYYDEHKEEKVAYFKQYYAEHKEERAVYQAKWRAEHKKEMNAKRAEYRSTPKGRASKLVASYKQIDKERGFDITDNISANYILKHIFTQPCYYCGIKDWREIGADRIDNSKGHTPDNVLPCCFKCNTVRSDRMSVAEMKAFVEEQKRLYPQDFKFEV